MGKKKNFSTIDSLKTVERVINESNEAIKDKSRTIVNSSIPDAIAGALGAVGGGAISFAALYGAGTVGLTAAGITSGLAAAGSLVGGGMVAGVFVLAAPVAVLGGGAAYGARCIRNKKLTQEKERLLKEAVAKIAALEEELTKRSSLSAERIKYLEGLIVLLQRAVKEMQEDLNSKQ